MNRVGPRQPSDALRARVLSAARAEPSPTRAERARQGALLALAAAAWLVGIFLGIGGVHADGRPAAHLLGTALGWGAGALLATWQAYGRGRSMLGRPGRRMLAVAVATPVILLGWVAACNSQYPDAIFPCPFAHGCKCLALTLLLAAAPLAALLLARRASDPVHPRATGAALGAAAGAWAAVLIDLRCPYTTLEHVAFGHALPVAVLGALGAWLGGRAVGIGAAEAR